MLVPDTSEEGAVTGERASEGGLPPLAALSDEQLAAMPEEELEELVVRAALAELPQARPAALREAFAGWVRAELERRRRRALGLPEGPPPYPDPPAQSAEEVEDEAWRLLELLDRRDRELAGRAPSAAELEAARERARHELDAAQRAAAAEVAAAEQAERARRRRHRELHP
ncbi:MAG: hypothetical protein KatS3mg102_0462 [Planctomycetota bacterium]|nr:MAG: hypothetical protein KatS3mg102_0462 [Planctomycetota bacterium]